MARWNILNSSDDTVDSPATRGEQITPSAGTDLTDFTRAIYVGTGGTLVVRLVDDTDDTTFVNIPDGSLIPLRVRAVRNTSTASNLVGLY